MNDISNLKIIMKHIIREQLDNENIFSMIYILVDSLYNVDREKARTTYNMLMNYVLSSHYHITDVIDLIYNEIINKNTSPMEKIRAIRIFDSLNNGMKPKGKDIKSKYIHLIHSV